MSVRNETYAIARAIPYLIQIGLPQTLAIPVRAPGSGEHVAPTLAGSTIQIKRPDGTSLVAASTAMTAVTSSIALYDLSAPAATEPTGLGWQILPTLVISGTTYPLRSPAIMCEYVPPNVVSAEDLYGRVPELQARIPKRQGATTLGGNGAGWQTQIDEAYYELIQEMLDNGRPIWKIREPTGYRRRLLARSVQLALRALPADTGGWLEKAQREAHFELSQANAGFKLQYDDEDVSIKRAGSQSFRLAPVGRPTW